MKALSPADLIAQGATMETVLRAAGAHAWTPEMIEKHKAAELAKAPRASVLYYCRHLYQFLFMTTVFACIASAVVLVLSALVFVGTALGSLLGYWPLHGTVSSMVLWSAVATVLTFLGAWFGLANDDKSLTEPAKWKKIQYGCVENCVVPMEALILANTAFAMMPRARVFVHALVQGKIILDPILEIEGQYVLVWDAEGKIIEPH